MNDSSLYRILPFLPGSVRSALTRLPQSVTEKLTELRLRAGNITTVFIDGENRYLCDTGICMEPARCVRITDSELEEFLYRFCGGSVYAFEDSVRRGYITRYGIRAGLFGKAASQNGEMTGFTQITGVNLRLPHHVPGCAAPLVSYFATHGFENGGLLVISPPGVGKTTLTGLMIQYLCKNGKTPILAVDADANSNLNEVLGVEAPPTLGEIREEIERAGMALHSPIPAGMAKGDYLQMRLEDAITEEKDFDLMVMGRTQGQGCYCFVNGLVQTQIQRLQANYPYLVVDNEAGMEHISRGLLPTMDVAILVSDCSRRGVQAAGRIAALMRELNFKPKQMGLIVNRAPDGKLDAGTMDEIQKQGLHLFGVVPQSDEVYRYDCDGKPTVQLPEGSPVRTALVQILQNIGL